MNVRRCTALLLLSLLFASAALAQDEPVTLDQTTFPRLLLKTMRPGVFVEAPAVRTEIAIRIRGPIARAVVKQTFENTTDHCVEALYAFPLADGATVDAMRLRVGLRTIDGVVKQREEAQRVYEEAKSEGRQASLLEQHRPNLFTVSVASLPAGEKAEVEIEYQQIAEYDGQFSLRIPLAIGPRYEPVAPAGGARRTSLPRMDHRPADPTRNPVTIDIDLDAGVPLAAVGATHDLDRVALSPTRLRLTPHNVAIASDRDFILTWSPLLGAMPQSAAFSEVSGGRRYTLLMLFPPDLAARQQAVLARDTTFIIDTSGSMAGESLKQAKAALQFALKRLRASDRFNVIEFNSSARRLFAESRAADRDAVEEAIDWVGRLESTGGTEMLSALQLAFDGPTTARADAVRQVIFITDGQVGNEPEIFGFIRAHLHDARLFTVGIGVAPNSYFMRTAARTGRGTFTQIGDIAHVGEQMTAMFRKLESPVLSDVALQVDAATEVWPATIPDLYAGEPLVVTMRGDAAGGRVTANGWNASFTATADGSTSGIARLWARQKIDAVRDTVFTGANEEAVRKEIVTLGLEHHLVTEYTSLVAVDTTPAGVDPKSCRSELVPINLPAGWGGIEAALPQGGTAWRLWVLAGVLMLGIAAAVRR